MDILDSIGMSLLALELDKTSTSATAWLEKAEVLRRLSDIHAQLGEACLDILHSWKAILRGASDQSHPSSVQEDARELHQQGFNDLIQSFNQRILALTKWIESIQDNGPDLEKTLKPDLGRDCGYCTRTGYACTWLDGDLSLKCHRCLRKGQVCKPRTEEDSSKRQTLMRKRSANNMDANKFSRVELNGTAISICQENQYLNWIHGTQFFEAAGIKEGSAGWLRDRLDIQDYSFQNFTGSAQYRGTYVDPWKLINILNEENTAKKLRKPLDKQIAAQRTSQIDSWIQDLCKEPDMLGDEAEFRCKIFEGTKVFVRMQDPCRNWINAQHLCEAVGINRPSAWLNVMRSRRPYIKEGSFVFKKGVKEACRGTYYSPEVFRRFLQEETMASHLVDHLLEYPIPPASDEMPQPQIIDPMDPRLGGGDIETSHGDSDPNR